MAHETVLITGASSGIGRELAKCFAADGCCLVLVARRGSALESLAGELRKNHRVDARVIVTALCPGPTETAFADAARMKDSLLFKMNRMSGRTVAEIGHRAFRQGRALEVPGLRNRMLAFCVRFSPRWMVRRVAATLNRGR